MRAALVWHGECEACDSGVGAVVDAVLNRANPCSDSGRGKSSGLPRKGRGQAPERIAAAVERGDNPFFVSLRPNAPGTARGGGSKAETRTDEGRRKRNEGRHARAASKRVKAEAAAAPVHVRRLTARKLRSMCAGSTKATAIFRLFKTASLEGQSRRVKSVRRREGRREQGGESRIVSVFWSAVSAVVLQRKAYKRMWRELWEARPVKCDDEPSLIRLLRSFPLFGLAVEVQRLRWRECTEGPCSTAEVVSSTPGIVVHESSAFLGVALLREGWAFPEELAEMQPDSAGVFHVCSETAEAGPLDPRILPVAKAFPGGTGAAEDIRRPVDATCVVAKVASEETGGDTTPFRLLTRPRFPAMSYDPFSVTLKTPVNTRAPLSDRVPKRRPIDEVVPATTALHHGIHTTYDSAYGPVSIRNDPSEGNYYLTMLRQQQPKLSSAGALSGSRGSIPFSTAVESNARKEPKTALDLSNKSRFSEPVSTQHMPTDWETEQQASSREIRPIVSHNFYSTARKIEREDDDLRSGLVGNTQRTVDIMRKRATNSMLRPATDVYSTYSPKRPPQETDASGRPDSYCLDIVDCTQLMPPSENHMGFDMNPLGRLPEAHALTQELPTQQRVITRMATSLPLFSGTVKVKETAIPHHSGHVPMHPHNVAMQRGLDTDPVRIWSKSFMTLAVHGGGVDASRSCKNALVPSRNGTRARPPKMLGPKKDETIVLTVEGSMLQDAFTKTLPAERAMNRRMDKK